MENGEYRTRRLQNENGDWRPGTGDGETKWRDETRPAATRLANAATNNNEAKMADGPADGWPNGGGGAGRGGECR